jgi:hypothetical protein
LLQLMASAIAIKRVPENIPSIEEKIVRLSRRGLLFSCSLAMIALVVVAAFRVVTIQP